MKKLLCILAVLAIATIASAELVQNHDFTGADETPWIHTGFWGSFVDLENDHYRGSGWGDGSSWSNNYVYQDTGAIFQADTVYTMTVEWRDPNAGGLDVENLQVIIQETTGWTDVAAKLTGPASAVDVWETTELVFDTASDPTLVGKGIAVAVKNQNVSAGCWMDVNSMSLVPEPMTIAILGLGGFFLRRRK